MNPFAESILFGKCVLYELRQNGVRLNQFAGLQLKVGAAVAHRQELKFGHPQLSVGARLRGSLLISVMVRVPKLPDSSASMAMGTCIWDIGGILFINNKQISPTKTNVVIEHSSLR